MQLDKYQSEALEVVRAGHNCLVVAGPGSGKTFTIESIVPTLKGRVLVLTHTRDARQVLLKRGIKASTIHSVCFWGLDCPVFNTFDCLLIYRGKQEFDWVVVDESQDMSYAQYEVVKSLGKNFIFVGDPFQSIFVFSGSYPGIFDDIRADLDPIEKHLINNYRSNQLMVDKLEAIFPRGLISKCKGLIRHTTAIIVRTRLEAEGISGLLRVANIRHQLITGDYRVRDWGTKIVVMTAHCSKGQEFDNVIIRPWELDSDEERRLHYVSVARARYKCTEERDAYSIVEEARNVDC